MTGILISFTISQFCYHSNRITACRRLFSYWLDTSLYQFFECIINLNKMMGFLQIYRVHMVYPLHCILTDTAHKIINKRLQCDIHITFATNIQTLHITQNTSSDRHQVSHVVLWPGRNSYQKQSWSPLSKQRAFEHQFQLKLIMALLTVTKAWNWPQIQSGRKRQAIQSKSRESNKQTGEIIQTLHVAFLCLCILVAGLT